ncbi:hypothetical protein [Edaphobacter bradus]|uniref:hypothetical protein n=1 Tax=Edaphobacter bradus TaxID=2259016 RepID=UPI0021DF847E|nr:hypothetical protein [Edaphobacter bradus]
MKSVLVLLAFIASGIQEAPITGHPSPAYERRGAVHREIAESSPFAREVIQQVAPEPGIQFKNTASNSPQPFIAIRAVIHNISDHELVYVNPQQFYDVFNSKTGERAPTTDTGCYVNFFLDCYTPTLPRGIPSTGPPKDVIPAHGSKNLMVGYLDMDYQLAPGTYTVVGYYCATQREGPECFKSNKITISIPEPTK